MSRRYSLVAVGDVAPQRPLASDAVSAILREGDCVLGNLEVVLTRGGEPQEKALRLRADPARAGELRGVPLDVLALANNHAMDYGWRGLAATMDALRAARLAFVGAGADEEKAFAPATRDEDGLRVGFLALACTLPNGSSAGPGRPGIAGMRVVSRIVLDPVTMDETPGMAPYVETECLASDVERVAQHVAAAHEGVDLLVVAVHWGIPPGWRAAFQGWLADYQRPLGHALVDAGADAVVGCHAHVLQGVEIHRSRPILYGLGNFVFHGLLSGGLELDRPYPPYATESLQTELDRVGGIAVLEWDRAELERGPQALIWPVVLDGAGEPRLPSGEVAASILARLADQCSHVGSSVRMLDTPHGAAAAILAA